MESSFLHWIPRFAVLIRERKAKSAKQMTSYNMRNTATDPLKNNVNKNKLYLQSPEPRVIERRIL